MTRQRSGRKSHSALAGLALAAGFALAASPPAAATSPPGVGTAPSDRVVTWGASADTTTATLTDQTVRNIVHTSVGGENLRITLTNTFGSQPVTFDAVYVGQQRAGAAIVPGTNRQVTFAGSKSVTIPVGAEATSDPLPGEVPAQQTLAVSLQLAGVGGTVTGHRVANQVSHVSTVGDHAADESAESFTTTTTNWFWIAALTLDAPRQVDTVVAFGDSITDGNGSTTSANRRWPDYLAGRILAQPATRQDGVSNQGISGNKVLADGTGTSGQVRFLHDALGQPDVETIIVTQGINDIRWDVATEPHDLITAYRLMIRRAHDRGVCVVGGTLTPWEGGSRYSETRNALREQVNAWIRDSGEFDAVVDFDRVTRDPQRPARFLPAYDSGDHLHPGDAGYQAMAAAVDLRRLDCHR